MASLISLLLVFGIQLNAANTTHELDCFKHIRIVAKDFKLVNKELKPSSKNNQLWIDIAQALELVTPRIHKVRPSPAPEGAEFLEHEAVAFLLCKQALALRQKDSPQLSPMLVQRIEKQFNSFDIFMAGFHSVKSETKPGANPKPAKR